MSEMNIIKARVSYQATVDSVIWKGYDALTREYSLKDTVDVEIPAGSHPHYALVLIADSISKQHQMEISGKLISPVPGSDARARLQDGRIQMGTHEIMVRGYMTLKIKFSENEAWLNSLAASTMSGKNVLQLKARKYHSIMFRKYCS
ncbi:TPA: hypothetical protein I4G69_004314 [Enterobacter asburiae]|nr:hypothetical protein [Enterobacter asburiae]